MYQEKKITSLFLLGALFAMPAELFSRQQLTDKAPVINVEKISEQPKTKRVKKALKKETKKTKAIKSVGSGKSDSQVNHEQSSKKVQNKQETGIKKEMVNEIGVLIYTNIPSQSGSDNKEFEKAPDVVLTKLALQRPSLDGRKRTIDEVVMDQLMYSEAIYFYRMVVPEDAVDKYINSIKEQHHLSDDQLKMMFKEVGYTYEEGRQQLAMGQAIDSLLNFKIRSRLVVLEKDVRTYYDAHPVYEEASYKIKKGFIPEDVFSEEQLKIVTSEMMKNPAVQWSTSYWLIEDEINDTFKETLKEMKQGSYSHVEPVTGGYEVVQLITIKPRALKSFEDRYREISIVLQEPQYYRLLDELKKELLDKYEVVYF